MGDDQHAERMGHGTVSDNTIIKTIGMVRYNMIIKTVGMCLGMCIWGMTKMLGQGTVRYDNII